MTKKIISAVLALCLLGCSLALPAAAQEPVGKIVLKLSSDVAGRTEEDYQAFITVVSGNVQSCMRHAGPVYASDYAGTPLQEAFVAGRTYFINYLLEATDGYVLPEKIDDCDLEIEYGKNIEVYSRQIVVSHARTDNGFVEDFRGLRIQARVLVDGNVLQRIIGLFHDIIIKIRAWSLY
ncbi:MAG: hypothetical protein IK118_01060 [Clostridia bacterium]|nr:hypothetical protein [Clostridia bacterium]